MRSDTAFPTVRHAPNPSGLPVSCGKQMVLRRQKRIKRNRQELGAQRIFAICSEPGGSIINRVLCTWFGFYSLYLSLVWVLCTWFGFYSLYLSLVWALCTWFGFLHVL